MKIFNLVEELEKERKKNKELEERINNVIELIESIEYFEKETKGIMRFPTMKIKNILKGSGNNE